MKERREIGLKDEVSDGCDRWYPWMIHGANLEFSKLKEKS
jgi:hypothetical protein